MYPGTWTESKPDRPAVVMTDTGRTLSFAELEERSTRLADALAQRGLTRGDVVAVLATNTPEYLEVLWATRRSGLVITGINHHLAAPEVAYILSNGGARALVCSTDRHHLARAALGELGPAADTVGVRLVIGDDGPAGPDDAQGFEDYETVLAGGSPEAPEDLPKGTDMLYSSGTTGRPKGIRPTLPEQQVDESPDMMIDTFAPLLGFDEDTVYLSPAPLYHAAPLRYCMMTTATGGTVLVMDRFDAETALAAIEEHRATHSQWVPTMFVRMLKLPREVRDSYDVSSLRVAVHAAAPCPVEVKQAMIEWWGPVLFEYYAATEAHGVTLVDAATWLQRPGTVGRAALGELRIVDDATGEVLPPGEIGTVYFERDELPFTYHGDEERTREAQHPDHPTWTTVGDVGRVDEDGYLYLTDRRAFTIISGGVNIYPQELEDALTLHPAVLDVAVVGVPDDDMGESVLAVVQPAEGTAGGEQLAEELTGFLAERVARFKLPRRWEFTDDMPRSATGKLVKRRLVERFA